MASLQGPVNLKRWTEPRPDVGLLVLRVVAGISLFALFGLMKVKDAATFIATGSWSFVDFNRRVGLPAPVFVAFAQTVNETLAALLVVVGLKARVAAACLTIGFTVATLASLRAHEQAWLFAIFYAAMFAMLALAGGGRFSLDHWLDRRARRD